MTKKFFCTLALVTTLVAVLVLMFSAPAAAQEGITIHPRPVLVTTPHVGTPRIGILGKVPPTCGNPSGSCLFYGGDFDPSASGANGLANETDLIIPALDKDSYGAAVYVPFLFTKGVKGKADWNITQLFTNNLTFTGVLDPPTCFWSINSGVTTGSGGTVIASGTDACTDTATGRSGFGLAEFTAQVTPATLPPTLEEGTQYWLIVVPQCTNPSDGACFTRFFESDAETSLNAVGPPEPVDMSFFDSGVFGFTFAPAQGVCGAGNGCDIFSAGLIGTHAK